MVQQHVRDHVLIIGVSKKDPKKRYTHTLVNKRGNSKRRQRKQPKNDLDSCLILWLGTENDQTRCSILCSK